MMDKTITLKPNKFFVGKYFDEVKADLKRMNDNTEDFGTVLYLNYNDYFIVVDEMYKLEIYYDETLQDINEKIYLIEAVIKDRINNFRFDKNNIKLIN